jgi:hypothetical protein
MKDIWLNLLAVILCMIFANPVCAGSGEVLRSFPIDDLEGVIDGDSVTLDKAVSWDGKGSLRIEAGDPVVVSLFRIKEIDLEDSKLIYKARVKTEGAKGAVYLEMWLTFPGKGSFFSRGLDNTITSDTDWTTLETPFLLKKGENPDTALLNIVINGKGTVWVDSIELIKTPL